MLGILSQPCKSLGSAQRRELNKTVDTLSKLSAPGPKRVLALDGGGIRGALSLGFLGEIERLLRERHGDSDLRLSDYFDLIGGTSVGAIIAAWLSVGTPVGDVQQRFLDLGGKVFRRRRWRKWSSFFDVGPLEEELARFCGDLTLGDPSIKTGLCIVTKRADTGSTWPLLNHPEARYYDHNRHILLRDALRASAAAPTYFVPHKLQVGPDEVGAFVDGGVSMANNPALQLFLIATLNGFPFRWPVGKDRLLLVSIGTGVWRRHDDVDEVSEGRLWDWATQVPSMLMEDASWQNQLILQYLSHTQTPWQIDSEVGDLSGDLLPPEPTLTYLRYNARLETDALAELGLAELAAQAESLRSMSAGQNVHDLLAIGRAAANQQVRQQHFPAAFDLN